MTPRAAEPATAILAYRSSMTEKALQDTLIKAARSLHFLVYHATDSRLNEPGFPDLVIVGHGRAWFLELKTATGKLRASSVTKRGRYLPGQHEWIHELQRAGVDAAVVRPSGLDAILAELKDAFEAMGDQP